MAFFPTVFSFSSPTKLFFLFLFVFFLFLFCHTGSQVPMCISIYNIKRKISWNKKLKQKRSLCERRCPVRVVGHDMDRPQANHASCRLSFINFNLYLPLSTSGILQETFPRDVRKADITNSRAFLGSLGKISLRNGEH